MGALLGYCMQKKDLKRLPPAGIIILLVLGMPSLMAAESMAQPHAPLVSVESTILIKAPPAVVWRHVLAFPPLAPPSDPLFYTGTAYPVGATTSKGTDQERYAAVNFPRALLWNL